jgi:CDGSH-type Zn-finger protein
MSDAPKIVIAENGPYLVSGNVPVTVERISEAGHESSWTWEVGTTIEVGAKYALCRCGLSAKKPFCDGSHAREGFDGTETATHATFAEQATVIEGPALDLHDADALCAFARFCDNRGGIWSSMAESDDADVRKLVVHEGEHCPSGRLVVTEKASGTPHEPHFAPSIVLVEDPTKACSGPVYVRGGIEVIGSDGNAYEVRNRVTLCRCGASKNKPFCDGTHADIGFTDGLS